MPAFPLFKYGYLFPHPDLVNNIYYIIHQDIEFPIFKCMTEKKSHTIIWYSSLIYVDLFQKKTIHNSRPIFFFSLGDMAGHNKSFSKIHI